MIKRTLKVTLVMAMFASVLVTAGSNSTTLSNGASLAVSIDDPVTSTEFEVPPGQPSINVPVTGTASVGLGEADATFVYVMDNSGSTGGGGGTGCSPILGCEKEFFIALNDAVAADGSTDEVGLVTFESVSVIRDVQAAAGHQNFTNPNDAFLDTVINGISPAGQTNCQAGLQNALVLVNASSNSVNHVVFASDGFCNVGNVGPAIAALAAAGAIVDSIAIGTGSDCASDPFGSGSLQEATANGGQCYEVPDPGNLPDLIDNLIGSTLDSLDLSVDGGPATAIPNSDISLPLPQPGAVSVDYTTPANGLAPGDHTICVTAHGSDSQGGSADVTQCETIHLLQLSASPNDAVNELGSDNTHIVIATIAGDPAQVAGRLVNFSVGGQNAGAAGVCSPNPACLTDASGQVSFTYSVPVAPSSLGNDTITVTTEIGGNTSSVTVTKRWVDTTAPTVSCPATVNPAGKNIPSASKTNEDGYFELVATDATDPNAQIFVADGGSSTVFGPFSSGTQIKYTQAPGATPSQSPGTGVIEWQLKGKGDMQVYAVDGSGNQSAPISCLVPPLPK